MFVAVFLKKVVVWFARIGFIALCTACASDNYRGSADSRADLNLTPGDRVGIKQATVEFNKPKIFPKSGGHDADGVDTAKSAQLRFKEIYDKYHGHTEKLAEAGKRDKAGTAPSITHHLAAVKQYRRIHTSLEQRHSLLAASDCLGRHNNARASYAKNWKPTGLGKAKMRPAKSNDMLRSFFYNRSVLSAGKPNLQQLGERGRFDSRYALSLGTTRLARYARSTSTFPVRPCEPKLSVLAKNNTLSKSVKKAQFNQMIAQAAQRHQVDEKLVHAVIQTESAYNANATSSAGAVGLMQLMPDTARRYGVSDRNDPDQNIDGGTRYLRYLLDLFNFNLDLAVAAYNAGEHAVMKYHNSIPPYPETRNYVRQVLSLYNR